MTTIRIAGPGDLLRLPTLDIDGIDGKVVNPFVGEKYIWDRYSLAADAPGGKLVGFLWAYVGQDILWGKKDEDWKKRTCGIIDNVAVSRLYNDEDIAVMEKLILKFEEILIFEETYYIRVDVPLSQSSIETYLKLGFSENAKMPRSDPLIIELLKDNMPIEKTQKQTASVSNKEVAVAGPTVKETREETACVTKKEIAVAGAGAADSADASTTSAQKERRKR